MVKTIYCAVTLLCVVGFSPYHMLAKHENTQSITTRADQRHLEKIDLDSHILRFVDGTSFIHIGNIMVTGKNILQLLNKKPMLYFKVDGSYKTVEDLAQLERNLYENRALDETYKESLEKARQQALSIFNNMTQQYADEIRAGKEYMVQLIDVWAERRDRLDTHLRKWASLNEEDEEKALNTGLPNFQEIEIFLQDLITFLADLVQNCPKSYQQYLNSIK